ncbi:hypothetical protein [Gimesia aquarii]|uniref:Uncharacterized protein n=1 Tax=Gimesia aquarii TaxID=2527964 RepID=A0A517X0Y0_9PLAN|nr:hypothetical protein [Gimesia aquarii]QDU11154.1 hypothetical protein V202x_45700 [Gimesia aquarii]
MSDSSGNLVPNNSPDDLEWLAFQYVSNALSEQDSQRFEESLGERQDAREALATVTQLIAGLKTIEPTPVSLSGTVTSKQTALDPRSGSSSRVQYWTLLGCAVALLCSVSYLLSVSPYWTTTNSQIVETEPSQDDLGQLLDLWSESAEGRSTTVSSNSNTVQIDLIDQQASLAEVDTLEVPDWLYTAVSLPDESVN